MGPLAVHPETGSVPNFSRNARGSGRLRKMPENAKPGSARWQGRAMAPWHEKSCAAGVRAGASTVAIAVITGMSARMASSTPHPPPGRGVSALPGCYIFLLGAALLVGAGIWGVYTFLRQADELKAFTDTQPSPLAVDSPPAGAVDALRGRLVAFADAGAAGKSAELVLTREDLNIMLAGFPRLADVRSLVRVRQLGPDATFTADVRFPMNALPGHRRYLNGEMDGRFGLHPEAGLFVSVIDVRVPGRKVPAGFLEVYQRGIIPGKNFGFLDEMLIRNFRDDPAFAAPLRRIASLKSGEGTLILSTVGTPAPPAGGGPGKAGAPQGSGE